MLLFDSLGFLTSPTGIIGLVLVNLTIKENVLQRDFYLLTLINQKSDGRSGRSK